MQNKWWCLGSCLVHFLKHTRWFTPVFVDVEFVLPLDWDIYSLVCPLKSLFLLIPLIGLNQSILYVVFCRCCECVLTWQILWYCICRWSMPLHGVMGSDVLIIVPTKALTEPQFKTLICFRHVIQAAVDDCRVSERPTEFVYPGETNRPVTSSLIPMDPQKVDRISKGSSPGENGGIHWHNGQVLWPWLSQSSTHFWWASWSQQLLWITHPSQACPSKRQRRLVPSIVYWSVELPWKHMQCCKSLRSQFYVYPISSSHESVPEKDGKTHLPLIEANPV